MKKYLEILRQCALFDHIEEEQLFTMLHCMGARVISFDKKYTILAEGNPAKYIGILLSGSAQMVQVDYYGNRSIVAGLEAPELFGEAFACAELPELPVTVIANEPCEVMLLHSDHILHTCSNQCGFHHQLIYNLMKALALKNIRFHQKLEVISKRSTREKLMAYLMMQAKKSGSSEFEIPFDRQELADYLDVDRSGLSVEISKLREEGVLESRRKHFRFL